MPTMTNDNGDPCTNNMRSYHILNIDGYSRTLAIILLPPWCHACSKTGFNYYPMGTSRGNTAIVVVFLVLLDVDHRPHRMKDRSGEPERVGE
jgi:hypothetical protein